MVLLFPQEEGVPLKGLQDFLRETAAEVDSQIYSFLPKKFSRQWYEYYFGRAEFGFDADAAQKSISDPVVDFLSRGGKRWRPALMLLACEAVGGKKKTALPFTPIPELVHNGTIITDDVEDGSTLRRGKPALHIIYGVDIAVNAGNTLYFLPLLPLLKDKKLSAEKKVLIYELFISEMAKLSLGQGMDIFWHRGQRDVSEGEYLQMCSFKTGSLVRIAAGLGGILGGAGEKQLDALKDFATSLGIAFQIQDDILNIRPNEGWGKETGDDIKEGKRTLMVIHAFSVLGEKEKARLKWILDSRHNSDLEIREAISTLERVGSISYASEFANGMVKGSWGKLDASLPNSRAKKMLRQFADYMVEREI